MPPPLLREVRGLLNGRHKVQKGRLQKGCWIIGFSGFKGGHGDQASRTMVDGDAC